MHFLILAIFFAFPSSLIGQLSEDNSMIKWERFVHLDFELTMPVSAVNYRPLSVPKEPSVFSQLIPSLKSYDLLEYRGANDSFFSTVQITAFDENLNIEGILTKIIQELKTNYTEVKDKKLVFENIERLADQNKIQMIFSGDKEVYTIEAYVSEKRVIMILLSDMSPDQKWTNKFLQGFKLRN